MQLITLAPSEIAAVQPQRIDTLVEQFISNQDVKEASRLVYRRTLKQYFQWVTRKGYLLSEIGRPQLMEYREDLLKAGKSSLTVGGYITSVRRFYEWTEANKYYPNVAKGIKAPRRIRMYRKQPLRPEQVGLLLAHFQTKAARDYAVVNLMLRTGLRTIEVIRASVGDIVYKGSKRVLLVHGKGRDEKDNFVELTDKAYGPIAAYLATRKDAKPTDPLFISVSNNSTGSRLTTRTVSFMAKEGLKAIGLSDRAFTAHSLHHTAGVNILRAGGTLEDAQFTLRHSNPATTQIYTATLDEERRLEKSGESLLDSMY